MRPFTYHRAASAAAAIEASRAGELTEPLPPVRSPGQFIAGGTTMLDLMKLDVMRPEVLVDINALTDAGYNQIEVNEAGMRLGALVRMAEAAEHPAVRADYPVIADTLKLAASQQLRNMASLGGNVLQRTRCSYFRDTSWARCNKRTPGSGCAARDGFNRLHAVLGTSEACIASYPGDFAQALMALDATIEIIGPEGEREMRFAELHRQPNANPEVETTLAPGEIITAIQVPAGPWTKRSRYVKVRDRESYAFALASAAVALDLDGEIVREARIALGGVATVPWRANTAEAALTSKQLDSDTARVAAEEAFANAHAYKHNGFKIELGKRTLTRALLEAKHMQIAEEHQ